MTVSSHRLPGQVLTHSYDTPTYVNHATPTTLADWKGYTDPVTGETDGKHFQRDIRK